MNFDDEVAKHLALRNSGHVKERTIIIPPIHTGVSSFLRTVGVRVHLRQLGGRLLEVVESTYPRINQTLRRAGYKVIGSVKLGGKSYKFIGKNIQPGKLPPRYGPLARARPLLYRYCPKCEHGLYTDKTKKCPNCTGRTRPKYQGTIKKDYRKVEAEQNRCTVSILSK